MDTNSYAPAIAALLAIPRRMPLDAGTPDRSVIDQLRHLDIASAFAPATVSDPDMARACLAGLWLRFDFLDESHRVSQEVHTPEGSYWHAILHRRESDFDNSKYWFRRVGNHPVFAPLGRTAQKLAVFPSGQWDPFAFVDRVDACLTGPNPDPEPLIRLQQAEWEALFDYCYAKAVQG
jgi:hypothetical protein